MAQVSGGLGRKTWGYLGWGSFPVAFTTLESARLQGLVIQGSNAAHCLSLLACNQQLHLPASFPGPG